MNADRAGRIPPPTKRLVVRKANSHRDLRPLTERVSLIENLNFGYFDCSLLRTFRSTVVVIFVCALSCWGLKESMAFLRQL